jgi:hypothetical protein
MINGIAVLALGIAVLLTVWVIVVWGSHYFGPQ